MFRTHSLIKCLHQITESADQPYGHCTICITDEHNKQCKGYIPVGLVMIEVADKGEIEVWEKLNE